MVSNKALETQALTYQFRVRGRSAVRHLRHLSKAVNLVWNYCNATTFHAIRDHSVWLHEYELHGLLKGSSKLLGLHSQTIQGIAEVYVASRVKHRKRKLRWRSSIGPKRSLGWVPFKRSGIKVEGSKAKYCGREIKFKKHREIEGTIKCGAFSEDALGHWYINLVAEVPVVETLHPVQEVGIDLGIKTVATLSDGAKIDNPQLYSTIESELSGLQRHGKKQRARKLLRRVKNQRKDFIHKKTLSLVKKYKTLFVGDVSGRFLQSSNGKSSADASTGLFRSTLRYKAIRYQGRVVDVSERISASTVTCSDCFARSGPSGLSGLRVREWMCKVCGTAHDRDVNAARNHLRVGSDALRAATAA